MINYKNRDFFLIYFIFLRDLNCRQLWKLCKLSHVKKKHKITQKYHSSCSFEMLESKIKGIVILSSVLASMSQFSEKKK